MVYPVSRRAYVKPTQVVIQISEPAVNEALRYDRMLVTYQRGYEELQTEEAAFGMVFCPRSDPAPCASSEGDLSTDG